MSDSNKRVIVYGYNASPFYQKTLNLLAHYRVPYDIVKTGFMPPRPMLSDVLNITYRRIPVMALDGQVYIDTSIIAQVLEVTFGGKAGHGSRLLSQQHILQKKVVLHWFDQQLFGITAALIPAKSLSKEFVEDRLKFGVKVGNTPQEVAKASLREQLMLLEEQLQDNESNHLGPYLMGTEEPQFVDLGVYTTLNWVRTMQKSVPEYLPIGSEASPFPLVLKMMDKLQEHIKKGAASLPKANLMDPKEAAKIIAESGKNAVDKIRGANGEVDQEDPIVKAGHFKYGDTVEVSPTDTGRIPQRGQLAAFTGRQISIIVNAGESANGAPFLTHFPRSFFRVQKVESSKL